jgi:hypothetical protein
VAWRAFQVRSSSFWLTAFPSWIGFSVQCEREALRVEAKEEASEGELGTRNSSRRSPSPFMSERLRLKDVCEDVCEVPRLSANVPAKGGG